jgi:hypothetical protein
MDAGDNIIVHDDPLSNVNDVGVVDFFVDFCCNWSPMYSKTRSGSAILSATLVTGLGLVLSAIVHR